jgi:hypothetical protein
MISPWDSDYVYKYLLNILIFFYYYITRKYLLVYLRVYLWLTNKESSQMGDIFRDIPLITRTYLTGAFLTTAACALDLVSPFSLYLNYNQILTQFEVNSAVFFIHFLCVSNIRFDFYVDQIIIFISFPSFLVNLLFIYLSINLDR